jgi:ATP-dependent DNA helicase RecG
MESPDELLARHEGKTLEFKRDLSSPERVLKTAVAFANGAGGTLLIGVEDRSRSVIGVSDPVEESSRLESMFMDLIEPRLVPEIQVLSWRRAQLLAVEVFPSSTRPHHLRRLGPEAGTFVRVGASTRRADPAQIEEIRRFSRGTTFDEEPRPELNSEAIDFRAASELFAEVRALKRSDLRTLGLTTRHQRRTVPTNGGILLFGVDREAVFPDSIARAACFAGRDRTEILDSARTSTHLPMVVDELVRFIRRNTRTGMTVADVRREDVPDYPLVAVREAVTNAVVHADYAQHGSTVRVAVFEDRLEVDNPGGLPPGLTIDEIRKGVSRLRNRVLGRVFHELRLIEQWGSGIPRMTRACREAGLPDPVLEEIGTGFRVTLCRDKRGAPELGPLDDRILEFVRETEGASTHEIAEHIGRTPRSTRTRMGRLVDLGVLIVVGKGTRDPRRVYRVPRG